MISIVISIRPEWACKILNREKTIEVRKGLALYNALKKAEERGEEVEFLMYVTKAKECLWLANDIEVINDGAEPDVNVEGRVITLGVSEKLEKGVYDMIKKRFPAAHRFGLTPYILNGKVVAKFKAKVEIIKENHSVPEAYYNGEREFTIYDTYDMDGDALLKKSCLSDEQMFSYLHDGKNIKSKGTALHIRDLEIFDKPKTLADYGLKRAPESWCYAKEAK